LGGSDQWGNITSGLELIRKTIPEASCVGITLPLVTKSDGTKFGKTASGALWLDPLKTSPYALYQFFVNAADSDVINYLKIFTFLSKEEIADLEVDLLNNPHLRNAQKKLAQEMVVLIHSQEDYENALRISQALFNGDLTSLNYDEIKDSFDGVETSYVEGDLNIVDFLVNSNITKSKREAREFITGNAISINGNIINDLNTIIYQEQAYNKELHIVRRGKKRYFKVCYQS
ncbi:MAG: tyrosine--tRNA ligase, partial [Bacilli bacterium]